MSKESRTHCMNCNEELTIYNSVYRGYIRDCRCRECYNENIKKYRQNPEYRHRINIWRKENRKRPEVLAKHKEGMKDLHFRNNYNINLEEYNKLVELHQGGCAICRQPCKTHERLSVDHDHNTGIVRGLLCQKCNTAIAMLNEDEDLFWNALEYLKKHKWNKIA